MQSSPSSQSWFERWRVAAVLLALLFFAAHALASNGTTVPGQPEEGTTVPGGGGGITNPIGCEDIRTCVENVITYVLGLAGVIALAGVVYGGFLYMTSGDNQDRITAGKNAVTYSVIGLIVIGLAYAIVVFVFQALG